MTCSALPFDGDAASWTVIVQFVGVKVQDVACAAFRIGMAGGGW
ncbi:hypothetical protein CGRA01v4_09111 [Colletotrichum graminicola]|nr:hypothetical protein CGRA01v4_09111 [Colletotrichum graminicola]